MPDGWEFLVIQFCCCATGLAFFGLVHLHHRCECRRVPISLRSLANQRAGVLEKIQHIREARAAAQSEACRSANGRPRHHIGV